MRITSSVDVLVDLGAPVVFKNYARVSYPQTDRIFNIFFLYSRILHQERASYFLGVNFIFNSYFKSR